MTVWKPTAGFKQALEEARRLEDFSLRIHWCCWVEKGQRALDRRIFKLIAPGDEHRELKPRLKQLFGRGWPEDEFLHLERLISSPLAPDSPLAKLKLNLKRSLRTDPFYSADPRHMGRFAVGDVDGAFSGHPDALAFYTQRGSAELIAGLWQGASQPDFEWLPEISVCRKYMAPDLVSYSEKDLTDLLALFLVRMEQDAIFLRMSVGEREYGWLFLQGDDGSPSYSYKGLLRCWRLQCNVGGKGIEWGDQAFNLLTLLRQSERDAWDSDQLKSIDEHVLRQEMAAAEEDKGLGASFKSGDIPGTLHVLRSGSPRFLLEPFFEPWVPNNPELLRREVPILLASEPLDETTRDLEYTLYRSDPQHGRCLCGRKYPHHPSRECPKVAPLRNAHGAWIQDRYVEDPDSRGTRWRWELLSSPYFYFCEDPNSLLDDADGSKDGEVRAEARRKWREITREMYSDGSPESPGSEGAAEPGRAAPSSDSPGSPEYRVGLR